MQRILVGGALVLVLGACSPDDRTAATERAAAVYAAAIDRVVAEASDDVDSSEDPVFVVAAPGHEVGIEVQVGVVDRLEELTVRFVDSPEEAIDESEDGAPVLDGGLLLTLGPIGGDGEERTVGIEAYGRADRVTSHDLTLAERDGRWVVVDQPERSN